MSYEVREKGKTANAPMIINSTNAISIGRHLNRLSYNNSEKAEWFFIEVIDDAGNWARKQYFKPVLGRGFVKTKEDLDKEEGKFSSVVQSLTNAILPEGYTTGKVDSFKDFCEKIMADIPRSMYTKNLRVKCIYDKKTGLPTLPAFGVVFEDPSRVTDQDSRMSVHPKDLVEPIKMDEDPLKPEENKVLNLEDLPSKNEAGIDDLPF